MRELAGLSFIERLQNVVILGPPGVVKTHLAVSLGVKAVETGYMELSQRRLETPSGAQLRCNTPCPFTFTETNLLDRSVLS